jgi:carboxymethylenebutenolidase
VRASAAHLNATHPAPTFTVGFCFGGSHSWRLSASELDLSGVMGFYGRPGMIADVEADLRVPVLLLVGGADAATPVEDFEALDARLSDTGVPHEMHIYPGAPHSFFDRAFADWQPACEDAWTRILDFTAAHA